MAFIRWKKNRFGLRQAYLIQSYRDAAGKPRHRTLAYLGQEGQLTPERIAWLEKRHATLSIQWPSIRSVAKPPPRGDLSALSDDDLMSRVRMLRREYGVNMRCFVLELIRRGVQAVEMPSGPEPLTLTLYSILERAFVEGNAQASYRATATALAPIIRAILRERADEQDPAVVPN